MTSIAQAANQLRDLLRPRGAGQPVNEHVVEHVRVPQPDFDAMQRLISQRLPEAESPKNDRGDDPN